MAPASPELDSLADRVGRVAIARRDAEWCDTIEQCVDGGFWGAARIDIPSSWAIDAAERVLAANEAGDAFYVFSLQDTESLGLALADALYHECDASGYWCLAFYGKNALN